MMLLQARTLLLQDLQAARGYSIINTSSSSVEEEEREAACASNSFFFFFQTDRACREGD